MKNSFEEHFSEYCRVLRIEGSQYKDEYMKQALGQLPVWDRTCLLLQMDGGFTSSEIAEMLEINEEKVKVYISNAQWKLRGLYRSFVDNEHTNPPVAESIYARFSRSLQGGEKQESQVIDGDLQILDLQSILKMLALSGKTGVLFVYSNQETLAISLHKGQIVALREEGVNQPDLLTMLCLINKLDPQRAQGVREVAQGNLQIALAMLVEQHWMSPTEMQQHLEFAIIQSISHALLWVKGRFSFHRQHVAMEDRMRPLEVDSVLLEALRQVDEWKEMGEISLTRTTVARWLPEVSNDIRSLGLSQEHIEVLCLANGEVSLQAMAMVLMVAEARIARVMVRLIELHLIEVIGTTLDVELQQDLINIIMTSQHTLTQHTLARRLQNLSPKQHLLGLIKILSQCIDGLLIHHGRYAKSLREAGQLPVAEVVQYLKQCFAQPLQLMARQQFPILDMTTFDNGQLDCSEIIRLDRLVRGEQLEEFYWEGARGLAMFLRRVFTTLWNDEIGNSHTGHLLDVVWKTFLTEIEQEIIYYVPQNARNRLDEAYQNGPSWNTIPQNEGNPLGSTESQRRFSYVDDKISW